MKLHLIPLFLLVLLAPSPAAQDEIPEIDPDVLDRVTLALRDPGRKSAEDLFDLAILEQKTIQPTLLHLDEVAADRERTDEVRQAANQVAGWMYWRHGQLRQATTRFEEAQRQDPEDLEVRLALAKLLDATGKTDDAIEAYKALLDELTVEDERAAMALRIALMELTGGGKDGREALAAHVQEEGISVDVRNRAAIVIALLGKPKDAIELYQVAEEGKAHTIDQIRIAEWALRAGEKEAAQEAAWDAVRTAVLKRDRTYGLTLLAEAYRRADKLEELTQRFAEAGALSAEEQRVRVEILREAEKYDEAIALVSEGEGEDLDPEIRRELLEMYREAGREDDMIAAYQDLIDAHPETALWREGLARTYLERGDAEAARAVWQDFESVAPAELLLHGAEALQGLGLYDRAREVARAADRNENERVSALLFQFGLERELGDLEAGEGVLRRLEESTEPGSPARFDLAECWEQMDNLPEATRILEAVKATRPDGEAGEDLEMRLAWLYSEIGDEEKALDAWVDLWTRVNSVPRRRYVEDRMMTVAARIGSLADIAIDIEEKLSAGTATDLEAGLLVRLYSKVGSSAAATEVIEEQFKVAGGSEIKLLEEKARIFMTCLDYAAYERTVKELILADPEGEAEYLQQLAMSMLERGRPIEARVVLKRLQHLEGLEVATEFEAGVLAIAGMRPEAIAVYRKGLAEHPGRIDAYLLLANLMKDIGQGKQAVGMFQYLMEFADKDDLFTIAVDGVLNMMVRPAAGTRAQVDWARRKTLERLAQRHDKSYLYQLLSDLAEERNDRKNMVTALENSVASAGPRRVSILRELMDLCHGTGDTFMGSGWEGDHEKHLDFGRRLIGVGDVVPPQVYLDLGESFLEAGDVRNATRTFNLTRDFPDHAAYQRHAARLFEEANEVSPALKIYESLLATRPNDVGLLIKVGELQEADGDDARARGLYASAVDLLLSRESLSATRGEDAPPEGVNAFLYYSGRNQDDWDRFQARAMSGELSATSSEVVNARLDELEASLRADLAAIAAEPLAEDEQDQLGKHPRVLRRASVFRRMALAFDEVERARQVDLELLRAFPDDQALLDNLVRARLMRGLMKAGLDLVTSSGREGKAYRALLSRMQPTPSVADLPRVLQPNEAIGMLVPLVSLSRRDDVREVLLRTDLSAVGKEDKAAATVLFSAAMWLEDENLTLRTGRRLLRLTLENSGGNAYSVQGVLTSVVGGVPKEERESLYRYFVSMILNDIEKYGGLMEMLPSLQKELSDPIADDEQLLALFEQFADRGYLYNAGPILAMLPDELEASSLRDAMTKAAANMKVYSLIQVIQGYPGEIPRGLADYLVNALEGAMKNDDNNWDPLQQLSYMNGRHAELMLRIADMVEKTDPEHESLTRTRIQNLTALDRADEAEALIAREWRKEIDAFLDKIEEDPEGRESKRQFRSRLRSRGSLKPEQANILRAELALVVAERGGTLKLTLLDLDLANFTGDEAVKAEALAAALEAQPEAKDVLKRAEDVYRAEGRLLDVVALLEARLAMEEKKTAIRARNEALYREWRILDHPEKALAAREAMGTKAPKEVATKRAEAEGGPGAAGSGGGGATSTTRVVTSGGVMIIRNGVMVSEDGSDHLTEVKAAIADGKPDEGQKHLRRYWRQFVKGIEPNDPYGFAFRGGSPMAWMQWPEDEEEPEAEKEKAPRKPPLPPGEVPRARGGLESWVEPELPPGPAEESEGETADAAPGSSSVSSSSGSTGVSSSATAVAAVPMTPAVSSTPATPVATLTLAAPTSGAAMVVAAEAEDEAAGQPEEPKNPYGILAEQDFGLEELERFLRTRTAGEVDGLPRAFYEGLLTGYIARNGAAATLRTLLTRLEAGTAGRAHQILMLTLLDEHPELVDEEVVTVLRSLERAVDPKDAVQVRRMARVLARAELTAEALELFLWCASRGPETYDPYTFDPFGNQGGVSTNQLLAEAKEFFEGEDRIRLVKAILSDDKFREPGGRVFFGQETISVQQVIAAWSEMLDPVEALGHARPACETVFDLTRGLRRGEAFAAAVLYAKAGEPENAVRALEIAWCEFAPDEVGQDSDIFFSRPQTGAAAIRDEQIRELCPRDWSSWQDPGAFLEALADAAEGWLAADRLIDRGAQRLLCIVALRLADHQRGERAQRLAVALAAREGWSLDQKLWIADTARRVGADATAAGIERTLLEQDRLPVLRMPDLLSHVLEIEGPEAALALGERCLALTRHDPLLAVLVAASEATGDPEVLAHWTGIREAAAAARAEVERLEYADFEERLADFEERERKRKEREEKKRREAEAEAAEEAAEGEVKDVDEASPDGGF